MLPKNEVFDQDGRVIQTDCVNGKEASKETMPSELPKYGLSDARPDPKPRKNFQLWQSYLCWFEFMELRKRHLLRISSAELGKSKYDIELEKTMIVEYQLDAILKQTKKQMIKFGEEISVWNWVTSIKGLGEGGLAAQLLSQIDDINKFNTVAALWRFSGFAVIEGKAEKNQKGETSKFNRKLKGICYNIADSFIKQQTPIYIDIYYAEKKRQKELNPDILCKQCQCKWEECSSKKSHTKLFSDAHIHNRAWRKMIKEFLKDLWINWRKLDHELGVIQLKRV